MTDLIACAHGTADPRGRRVVHELVRRIARLRPDLPMSLGFVDVDLPALPELTGRVVADGTEAVVVPLLLSAGYHVRTDIAGVCGPAVRAAGALGPDPLLAEILADRLDPRGCDRVVLAAAGSSDSRALLDCELTASLLSSVVGLPVDTGYVSGAGPRLADVVRRAGGRVAVATYLLAPGTFADHVRRVARAAGAVSCSEPLGADWRIASLALARYDAVVRSADRDFEPIGVLVTRLSPAPMRAPLEAARERRIASRFGDVPSVHGRYARPLVLPGTVSERGRPPGDV